MTASDNFSRIASAPVVEPEPNMVTKIVSQLETPAPLFWEEAGQAAPTMDEHDRLAAKLPALASIEVNRIPDDRTITRETLLVAAWNAERLKYREASAERIQATGADIVLLSEADIGMARSGNRHTVADLARDLGMSYAYGVEFVEMGLGDSREREWHRNEANAVGFHGNAILTRLPMLDVTLIRLDDGGVWWSDAMDGQGRFGYRMAIAARLQTEAGSLAAVAAHLESKSDATDRARQTARLLEAVDRFAGDLPVVIGGDFNTNALPEQCRDPLGFEPLFNVLAEHGYDWERANDFALTQRTRPDGTPTPPFARLDWLFTRNIGASNPRTIAAIDETNAAISDHELVIADISPRDRP
ncbi:endonuclease/exonuclease/phosphatase family metal-dependent hydrolase [Ochrobactrum daejeonense]|uniref:Endonuclease/exonuclease/phosphatase family metal-dependent hydrolase n=1 Tax=Brucella daejeonensis TaxID=659015 RepID=A0A7W9B0G0_9HYPH|nr:endonuclease/exonuclease/phosphatase family protein [Brucella daejeonensis]MBB5703960.1 endonuclease/exonuclease/phosphatase family metal-dependent hydrolase [Brucella daejeonensis]